MNGTLTFILQKDKKNKKGEHPIRAAYNIKGDKIRLGTGLNIAASNWENGRAVYFSKDECRAKGIVFINQPLKKDIELINVKLGTFRNTIAGIETAFKVKGIKYSVTDVKEAYGRIKKDKDPTRKDESRELVYAYIDKYVSEQSTTLAKATLVIYSTLRKHLVAFGKDKSRKIAFAEMDKSFFKAFQNYLIEDKGMMNTTVAKQLSTLKTLLRYAEDAGIETPSNYKGFTIKREPLPVIALTEQELEEIFYFDFSDHTKIITGIREPKVSYATLDRVRDIFCMMCETGLRFSDVQYLKRINIVGDELRLTTLKTKQRLNIPITEYARLIFKKYEESPKPLPTISNQRFNNYLKDVCKEIGITSPVEITRFYGAERRTDVMPKFELITAHTGRKTFCTLSLARGMQTEQVMKISGHTSYKSFKVYVNVTDEIAANAVKQTRGTVDYTRLLKIAK